MLLNIEWFLKLLCEIGLWLLIFIQFIFFLISEYYKVNNERNIKFIFYNYIYGLLLIFYINYIQINQYGYVFFNEIKKDNLTNFFFLILLFSFFISIIYIYTYAQEDIIMEYEYLFILGFAFIGMIILLTSNDFLVVYLGLELQSLSLYILAAYKQYSYYSNEAGLKYFILGSLASGIILYGISLIYGSIGLINFNEISYFLFISSSEEINVSLMVGFILFFIGFFFKLGVVPFHMWLPDVYEGIPTGLLSFFSIVSKIAFLSILIKFILFVLYIDFFYWSVLFFYCAIFSIFVGSLGALYQKSIKRLLAYSAISHIGYLIISLSLGSFEGIFSVLFYLVVYIIIMFNIFGIMLTLRLQSNNRLIKLIGNYNIIYNNNKLLGFFLIMSFFSLAGIPPLAGFFSKIYIYISMLINTYYISAICIILISVISIVYYIKIIKIMLFSGLREFSFLLPIKDGLAYVISITGIINIFLGIFCMPILLLIHEIILEAYLQ